MSQLLAIRGSCLFNYAPHETLSRWEGSRCLHPLQNVIQRSAEGTGGFHLDGGERCGKPQGIFNGMIQPARQVRSYNGVPATHPAVCASVGKLHKGGLELGITKSRVRSMGCPFATFYFFVIGDINHDGLLDIGAVKEEIRCDWAYNE